VRHLQITYEGIVDKKEFGHSVNEHLVEALGFWPCFRLMWSVYFGKTPGVATTTIKVSNEQAAMFISEIRRLKKLIEK
jgi:hypothetical protein